MDSVCENYSLSKVYLSDLVISATRRASDRRDTTSPRLRKLTIAKKLQKSQ